MAIGIVQFLFINERFGKPRVDDLKKRSCGLGAGFCQAGIGNNLGQECAQFGAAMRNYVFEEGGSGGWESAALPA